MRIDPAHIAEILGTQLAVGVVKVYFDLVGGSGPCGHLEHSLDRALLAVDALVPVLHVSIIVPID